MLDVDTSSAAPPAPGLVRNIGSGRSAVRCLFGPPDVEETRQFLCTELRKIAEEQMRRWNFDFDEGRPLRGRYRWEPYPQTGDVAPPARGAASHSEEAREDAATVLTARAAVAGRQLRIPDFFPKRKRLAGSDIATPKATCCAAGGEAALVRPLAVRASDRPPTLLSNTAMELSSSSTLQTPATANYDN